METAPKGDGALPAGGVWAVEGTWEDEEHTPILTMDEDGNATFNEPKGPEAMATITYTYWKPVEKAPAKAPDTVVPTEPTVEPTTEVTEEPTSEASTEATVEPTEEPTGEPTPEVTEEPTVEPTTEVTEEPTVEPTPEVTDEPTVEPTAEVTEEPSQAPDTQEEQKTDDVIVSDDPVPQAEGPEDDVVDEPVDEPADVPADEPSDEPTDAPGDEPADEPTDIPADEPTDEPTDAPAGEPVDVPVDDATDDDQETVSAPATELVEVVLTWKVLFTSTVMELAGTIKCDNTDISRESYFERADGNHVITLTGGYEWKGRLVFGGAHTVTIKGDGIINADGKGSAITVNPGCTVILEGNVTIKGGSGQYISSWPETDSNGNPVSYGHTVGGGVCIRVKEENNVSAPYGTFIMRADENGKAPTITDNSAGAGGGIYVDSRTWHTGSGASRVNYQNNAKLYIYAGKINGNHATGVQRKNNAVGGMDCGGGGIWVNGTALIDPTKDRGGDIEIKNNISRTIMDLGGGGIYVNNPGSLSVKNAVITGNHADGLGGDVASCVHGNVGIVNINNNGAAIYSNTTGKPGGGYAYDMNEARTSSSYWNHGLTGLNGHEGSLGNFVDGYSKWYNNEAFKVAAKDIFCAGATANGGGTVISDTRPMNSSAEWTGYTKDTVNSGFKQITKANNGYIYGGFLLGLTAGNTKGPGFEGYKVTISGNSSATHGGGIATNGILAMSYVPTDVPVAVENYSVDGAVPLNVSKALTGADIAKNSFTFEIVDATGNVLDTDTTDEKGELKLDYGSIFNQNSAPASAYTFYIREKANSNTVTNNTTYQVTVPIVAANPASKTYTDDEAKIQVTIHYYRVGTVTMKKGTGVGNDWVKADNASAISYTNTWKTDGQLTIIKALEKPALAKAGEKFTFQITLTDKDDKGISIPNGTYGDVTFTNGVATATLEVTEDGKAPEAKTISGLPVGLHYTVTETGMATGYVGKGEVTQTGTVVSGNTKVTITNTRNTAELSVAKKVTWNGDQSQAPENLTSQDFTVVVKLGSGEGEKVTGTTGDNAYKENGVYTFTLNPGNGNGTAGAAAKITGIPTGTKYTVEEQGLTEAQTSAGYSIEDGTAEGTLNEKADVIVENRYFKTKTTKLAVLKAFDGGNNYWPMSVTAQLFQNEEEYGAPVELNEDNNWTYDLWTELPMYSAENAPYTYRVEETSVNYFEYPDSYKADALAGGIIRVRDTAHKTVDSTDENPVYEIVGGWKVNNGGSVAATDGTMTEKITITNKWLPARQAVKASISIHKVDKDDQTLPIPGVQFTLTKADGTKVSADNLGYTDQSGNVTFTGLTQGTYTLKETVIHTGYLDSNKDREWTIIVGQGNNLQSVKELTPETDNDPVGENTWSWTDGEGTRMPNDNGVISWATNEDCLGGTLTITNEVIKGKLSITKKLDLDGVTDGFTGEPAEKKFTFDVYAEKVFGLADGTKVGTLAIKVDETKHLEDLRYGTYLIVESGDTALTDYDFDGMTIKGTTGNTTFNDQNAYRVMVKEGGETVAVTATNHYTRHTTGIQLTKTVTGNRGEQDRLWNFNIYLTAPADYVKLADSYEATVRTPVKDVNGTPTGEYTEKTVTVERTEPAPAESAAPEETEEPVPTESASVERTEPAPYKVALKHGQTVVIEGLPVGTAYKIEEVEAGQDGYSTAPENEEGTLELKENDAYTEVTFTNSRSSSSSNTVNVSVRKVWRGDDENVRPTSIEVQLLRDGEPYNDTVTLNESNGWSYSWGELSRNNTWSVEEVDVPEGYTSSITGSGRFTITNTYTGTTPTPTPTPSETPTPGETPTPSETPTPVEEFDEPDVPLADLPHNEEEEILDEDVPLANVPNTGDNAGFWLFGAGLSGLGLLGLLTHRRKEEEG